MSSTRIVFKDNSLDLLRLIAAAQVMISHTLDVTFPETSQNVFIQILNFFPGVPIFFFVSGFLISRSYENAKSPIHYWQNRILRIYPALVICVFLNIFMVGLTGFYSKVGAGFFDLSLLFIAKSTILQFYNPDFMRTFGDGVLNGSLWTICVELQFYIAVPILYKFFLEKTRHVNVWLVVLIFLFLGFNRLLNATIMEYGDSIPWKLFRVSFIPWIYMFFVGLFVQRNFDRLSAVFFKVHLLPLVGAYVALCYFLTSKNFEIGNYLSPILFFPLVLVIFRFAYSGASLTRKLLKGNDISYGIYIWHMPLLNQCLYLIPEMKIATLLITLIGTLVVSLLSWNFVERRALKLKKVSLK
ncbi:acyltransferase [Reinekea sp. G2M2-21]|uniref:acyltransferase family protein n=1 Tax=Reinekea sp. G2M2-21 TaxID=2788942 RepID=UPI0018A8B625|nr:acyltransferase [Reinekea sp. G2M2-21]